MIYKVVACDSCSYLWRKTRYFVTTARDQFKCPICGKTFRFGNKIKPRVFFETEIGREASLLVSKLNGVK